MRLNLFSSLPNPREVWSWGMYDLANQSFQLLINTLLMGVFIAQVVAGTPEEGERFWARIGAASLFIAVLLSPIVGAVADQRAWKHELLMATGIACGVLMCVLAIVAPGQLWLVALLYIPASVMCSLGENLLASFLPQLATPQTMGRVSALGFMMSYAGAIVLQLLMLAAVLGLGWSAPADWRPLFVVAGLWFLGGIVPSFFFLRERATPAPGPQPSPLVAGARRLRDTITHASRHRQLMRFLAIFFVYSLGTQSVIFLSTLVARRIGFKEQELFGLVLLLSITAGIAAALVGRYQDRVGARRTIQAVLAVWVLTAAGLATLTLVSPPKWMFWAVSLGVGLGIGGIGTASRAMVGLFTPEARAAEFFGLWGMVFRLAGATTLLVFSELLVGRASAVILFCLAGFFFLGLVLLPLVDEAEGRAAASAGA